MVRHVPKLEIRTVDRVVEVPQVQYVEKLVEVPKVEIQDLFDPFRTRFVPFSPRFRGLLGALRALFIAFEERRSGCTTCRRSTHKWWRSWWRLPQVQYVEKFVEVPQVQVQEVVRQGFESSLL